MNVLIAVDQLYKRDNSTLIVEQLMALFPEASLATITHVPGAIGGRVETAKIYSTFLSNLIKNKNDFNKYLPLVPSAINNLKIADKIDLLICVSSGLIHGLEVAGAKKYTYLYEWDSFLDTKLPILTKMSKFYVNSWREKKLVSIKNLSLSTNFYNTHLDLKDKTVIAPFFNGEKVGYNDELNPFSKAKNIVFLATEYNEKLENYLTYFSGKEIELSILGTTDMRIKNFDAHYLAPLNLDSIAKYCSHAWLTVDCSSFELPEFALHAMASGSCVLTQDTAINREIFGDRYGVYFNPSEIDFEAIQNNFSDRRKIRRNCLRLNGRIFKAKTQKLLSDSGLV